VRHLIVLPSPGLSGLPLEALLAARSAEGRSFVVSYAPSGTMLTRLRRSRPDPSGPTRLLALGDPAFPPANPEPPPPPPDHGVAVLAVEPNGPAGLFGVRPGDVLLEYNGQVLHKPQDLEYVPAQAGTRRVALKLWRHGEARTLKVATGPLGLRLDTRRSAALTVLDRRVAADILDTTRGQEWKPLPGTRREVGAVAALFPNTQVTALLGPEATESALQRLARAGELARYRYLHLATHGWADPAEGLSSALLLAPDPDRSADPTAAETDGRITAEQIVQTWNLDAELVVLSACESGMGRPTSGEGYLGFSQALFVKGARSLVVSLWKVDDTATALLMARFYQNLLGRRAGLSQPLPKAEALHEAKGWLRGLRRDEAVGLAARLGAAGERGKGVDRREPSGPPPAARPGPGDDRPYDHPYYWAAFILVGDPG
jgi:CHAT domain-containing protein